jgi:hypothetical protein
MSGSAPGRQARGGFDATIIHRGGRGPFELRSWPHAEHDEYTGHRTDISARDPRFHLGLSNRNPAGCDSNRSWRHRAHADRSDVEQLKLRWEHFILHGDGRILYRDSGRRRVGNNGNNVVIRWWGHGFGEHFEQLLFAVVRCGFVDWNGFTAVDPRSKRDIKPWQWCHPARRNGNRQWRR